MFPGVVVVVVVVVIFDDAEFEVSDDTVDNFLVVFGVIDFTKFGIVVVVDAIVDVVNSEIVADTVNLLCRVVVIKDLIS